MKIASIIFMLVASGFTALFFFAIANLFVSFEVALVIASIVFGVVICTGYDWRSVLQQ
jgi:hypothetical protein